VGELIRKQVTDKVNGKKYAHLKKNLNGEKNGESGAQNLPLGKEPRVVVVVVVS